MLRKKLKMDHDPAAVQEFAQKPQNQLQNPSKHATTSHHFTKRHFWELLDEIECNLSEELKSLRFPRDVAAVYNPLEYAREIHTHYMAKFLDKPKKIVFLGMNPGPFGMCQTGVLIVRHFVVVFL
jgi:single-strand selective monofunctional uracil DNA glycosylase